MLTSSTYFYKYTVEKITNNTLTLNQNNYQTLISAEFNKKKVRRLGGNARLGVSLTVGSRIVSVCVLLYS